MRISDIDKDLALKLGDPAEAGADGEVFDFEDRVRYISRGYGRLIRNLTKMMDKKVPEFANRLSYYTAKVGRDVGQAGTEEYGILKVPPFLDVKSVYLKSGNTTIKANSIDAENFVDIKSGNNKHYTASATQIYFTIMAFAADKESKDELVVMPGFKKISATPIDFECLYIGQPGEFTKVDDYVDITSDYKDLLIANAAYEAMMDLARQDKAQLYKQDIVNELQILLNYSQLAETKKGVTNG